VLDVFGGGVAEVSGVLGLGLTGPEGLELAGGVVVELGAPLVVSLGAPLVVSLGAELGALVEALAPAPVAAPDDRSIDARLLGDAVR
jgi:hypothetical protein